MNSDLAKTVSGVERLRSLSVRDKMRPLALIKYMTLGSDNNVKLSNIVETFGSFERFLFLNADSSFRFLIYRSMIDRFVSRFSLGSPLPAGATTTGDLTLSNLLDSDAKLRTLFESSAGFVPVTSTLADAKRVMDMIDKCADIFVTQSGDKKEPILGWITDTAILDNSRV
jgi:hypothetical protein